MVLFGGVLGVLVALIASGVNASKGKAKVRALIASDQAILQSLTSGSPAADVLDARIQATVTVYANNLVLPSARRGAAVMGGISAVFLTGFLAVAWNSRSTEVEQFVWSFFPGFFAVNVGLCLRILLHRNRMWATPAPEAASVGQGVIAEDDGKLDKLPEALPNP
jgi:hypothetical protein